MPRLGGLWEVGSTVEIKGAISDGVFRATEVESEEDKGKAEAEERKRSQFELEGRVESVQRDENDNIVSIVVDGQTVLVQAIAQVKGTVEVGVTVEVKGIVSGDEHIASRIKSEKEDKDAQGSSSSGRGNDQDRSGSGSSSAADQGDSSDDEDAESSDGSGSDSDGERSGSSDNSSEFKLEGRVEAINRDRDGNIVSIVLEGTTVVVDTTTEVRGTVEVRSTVEIRGNVSGDTRVASRIEVEE